MLQNNYETTQYDSSEAQLMHSNVAVRMSAISYNDELNYTD